MKDKERDIFDDLFRSKLQDFEVDVKKDDWERISNRLSTQTFVPFRKRIWYWSVAAIFLLLITVGGLYVYHLEQNVSNILSYQNLARKEFNDSIQTIEHTVVDKSEHIILAKKTVGVESMSKSVLKQTFDVTDINISPLQTRGIEERVDDNFIPKKKVLKQCDFTKTNPCNLSENQDFIKKRKKEKSIKRWSFGVGGGSVTTGTSDALNIYALKSSSVADQELLQLNSAYFNEQSPKTNVHHKTPITFGIGVGYHLSERFSLLSGLNYTYLVSEWETNAIYKGKTKQKLHFLGIPLSLSYKITEWRQIQFYAAAGTMAEINVAGKQRVNILVDDVVIGNETNYIRMKKLLWSVNTRIGASYPLHRFINIYAEAGINYYFDNGSDIETIRSEKPFNVNLQVGFRFGF
ncbi:MAG: porin family protein [Parabacteroides sp.]|nr:porin family protein [Parabacteroides sp.]